MNKSTTRRIAKQLANRLKASDGGVVLLHGEMGAGKTTLVSYIMKYLDKSVKTCSPTYSIINQYADNIFHADLYRGQSDIGLEDLLTQGNYVFIEWAGQLEIPNAISVKINVKENGDREFVID